MNLLWRVALGSERSPVLADLQRCGLAEVRSVLWLVQDHLRIPQPLESCTHSLNLVPHRNNVELLGSLAFVPDEIAWPKLAYVCFFTEVSDQRLASLFVIPK